MRLLLDTHTFLWFVWDDRQLSLPAKTAIESDANEIYLSAASPWEVSIKVSTGKLSVGQEVDAYFEEHLSRNRVNLLPISLAHVGRVAILPFHHKDPFDRLLIAQSLTETLPLVSADSMFDRYGVTRVW
jgi:PIN domain nuclease of toxin-antitoxin system